jgi:hypothetical protein
MDQNLFFGSGSSTVSQLLVGFIVNVWMDEEEIPLCVIPEEVKFSRTLIAGHKFQMFSTFE